MTLLLDTKVYVGSLAPLGHALSFCRTCGKEARRAEVLTYPNPTSDMVIIELSQYPLTDQARYRIMNIEGKLVMEGKLNTHQDAVLDLTQLQTGSYRILLLDQDELIQESQIVKQ